MKLGYIRLHRQIIDSAIWSKPPLYIKVWLYLLLRAQHTEFNKLRTGQLRTSIPDIIEACKWKMGARTERPTKDQIYQIIQFLRDPDGGGNESNAGATSITTTKATHGLLITILKYSHFQTNPNDESNDESNGGTSTEGARGQRQPSNINRECNNETISNDIEAILNKLSSVTGSRFGANVKSYQSVIKARLKEKYSVEDFITVIEDKFKDWGHKPDFKKNLKPSTLFSAKHFDEYLQIATAKQPIIKHLHHGTINQNDHEAYENFISGQ